MVGLVAVGRVVEPRLPPPFCDGEQRRDRERHQQPAADPVSDGRLDEQDEEELVDRRADLVLVQEDEGRDDHRVDNESEQVEQAGRANKNRGTAEQVEGDPGDRQQTGCRPGPALIARRIIRAQQPDLDDCEGRGGETYPRDPALRLAKLVQRRRHRAATSSFASAMPAFRWRKRPSFRGT